MATIRTTPITPNTPNRTDETDTNTVPRNLVFSSPRTARRTTGTLFASNPSHDTDTRHSSDDSAIRVSLNEQRSVFPSSVDISKHSIGRAVSLVVFVAIRTTAKLHGIR
ncbi:hypothetical protein BLNAU_15282 [Blattamonas nauphoetae]|uniref:Uncharacterized protein n=1 Tax=Blattamonas nauphoetae TaxID=2049346 RepID=A0ABQ9XF07_9EUKA|nr:hypothetical protein BLNAU_15282 [Blattamonas nauphoetae]